MISTDHVVEGTIESGYIDFLILQRRRRRATVFEHFAKIIQKTLEIVIPNIFTMKNSMLIFKLCMITDMVVNTSKCYCNLLEWTFKVFDSGKDERVDAV